MTLSIIEENSEGQEDAEDTRPSGKDGRMRVIAGKARRLTLKTVKGDRTRPTTDRIKETLFNILRDELPGARFLDLFAGSGGIGIEALSEGAEFAVFADSSREAAACIRDNLKTTRLEQSARVMHSDAVRAIHQLIFEKAGPFHIIYMDPPYQLGAERQVLAALAGSVLLGEDTIVIIEAAKETPFDWVAEEGFVIIRQKEYKTNKHIFVKYRRDTI